jgi:hypothetical protein
LSSSAKIYEIEKDRKEKIGTGTIFITRYEYIYILNFNAKNR